MLTPISLIVGLGNPGPEYMPTRHNVGAWFIDRLAQQQGILLRPENKFHGQFCKTVIKSHSCWLLFPTTYMNHSGQAVRAVAQFYKIEPENILVVHDELDFPAGVVRFKQNGGHGGHNGLRDIIAHLKSKAFYRLRIGIDHPGARNRVIDYVLSRPSHKDCEHIIDGINRALDVLAEFIGGNRQKAMTTLHSEQT